MLSVINKTMMLSLTMLSAVMLNVIMQNDMAPHLKVMASTTIK
jgi:hypothetical protein